jgi:hypothetical protein
MGKLYQLKRKAGKITAQVMDEGEVIHGKWVPPGNVKVVSGTNGEVYWLTPQTARTNYDLDDDFLAELAKANGWDNG